MKPILLEFCGINSFSEPTKIDFEKLSEYGIFGIFGETGSGKSTILDCIVYALYGTVSRVKSMCDAVNHNLDKAYCNFEFEITHGEGRHTYRVERIVKRKNSSQSAKLYEKEGENWVAVVEGKNETDKKLSEIIGLDKGDFERVIALPQGEFAKFVHSAPVERLRLVARLFDLESYGDLLMTKVKNHLLQLNGDLLTVTTRLEPFALLTKDSIKETEENVKLLSERLENLRKEVSTLQIERERLSILVKRKADVERARARFEELEAEKATIETLRDKLEKLVFASEVVKEDEELSASIEVSDKAKQEESKANEAFLHADTAMKKAFDWDAEAMDLRIEREQELLRTVVEAEKLKKSLDEKEIELERKREAYKKLQDDPKMKFNYELEKAELEKKYPQTETLDFGSYLEKHASALFSGEYKKFADELKEIETTYPVTKTATSPLIEKYVALSLKTEDYGALKSGFERERALLKERQEKLVELEKRNGDFKACREKLTQMEEQGKLLREEISKSRGDIPTDLPPQDKLEESVRNLKAERKMRSDAEMKARDERAKWAEVLAKCTAEAKACAERVSVCKRRLASGLKKAELSSVDEAKTLISELGLPEVAKRKIESFDRDYITVSELVKTAEDFTGVSEEKLQLVATSLQTAETERDKANETHAVLQEKLKVYEADWVKKCELEKQRKALEANVNVFERMKKLVEHNKFMEFVAEEYLEIVAKNAGARLLKLTNGRYFLRYEGATKGGNFVVGDNFNGGITRGVYTLSGGETFLVSLSLALALGAEICARSLRPIEFFFLDEGFGTLDGKLVDTVMNSLEKLRGEHFTIGVISHVEELKNRIERKLLVQKASETSGSKITLV